MPCFANGAASVMHRTKRDDVPPIIAATRSPGLNVMRLRWPASTGETSKLSDLLKELGIRYLQSRSAFRMPFSLAAEPLRCRDI